MERLEEFGLPETFPPFMVPEKAARFVADTKKGMSKDDLLAMADVRGFSPLWKPLPHMGSGVYGLGLDVDGMQVPFMVRMRSNVQRNRRPERAARREPGSVAGRASG